MNKSIKETSATPIFTLHFQEEYFCKYHKKRVFVISLGTGNASKTFCTDCISNFLERHIGTPCKAEEGSQKWMNL